MCEGFRRGGRGFEDASESDRRAIRDASCYAAGDMIDSRTGLCHAAETGSVFESLAGVDGHDCKSQFGLQFVENGLSYSDGKPFNRTFYDASDRISVALVSGNRFCEFGGVCFCSHLNERSMNGDSFGSQLLFRDTSCDDACRRFPRRGSSSSPVIADAVFLLVRFIGVPDAV